MDKSVLIIEKNSELWKIVSRVLKSWKNFGKGVRKDLDDKEQWGKPAFSLDDESDFEDIELNEKEKSWGHIMACTKKIIIVDGDKYDVVKSRDGIPTKNGHTDFLVNEMKNDYN